MSVIPAKLLMLRPIADVPISEYSDLPATKDLTDAKERLSFLKRLRQKPDSSPQSRDKVKHLSFNAAVWLDIHDSVSKPVSLWLRYKDSRGEQSILVDEQHLKESSSAMLSGNACIKVVGALEYLRTCCGGLSANERFSVDEVHVRRLDNEMQNITSIKKTA